VIPRGRVPGGAGPAGWWSWTSELVELDQRAGGAGPASWWSWTSELVELDQQAGGAGPAGGVLNSFYHIIYKTRIVNI
jgi:hypothetical protein